MLGDQNYNDIDYINKIINKYYVCGWTGHAIVIFINQNNPPKDQPLNITYNFGIINCGSGVSFQGKNNNGLCNGMCIFKKISQEKILKFFTMYKIYITYTNQIEGKYIYKSFYLMLFKILLDTEQVNFQHEQIKLYKLKQQSIGSCIFTNIINIVYDLYIKSKIREESDNIIYEKYLDWYNKVKRIIKLCIYEEIITSQNLKDYNIYKYIVDTTDDISENENYEKIINNINVNMYNYIINSPLTSTISQNTKSKFNISSISLTNLLNEDIDDLFNFFYNIKLFDNNMKLLIPLLLLYDYKKNNSTYIFNKITLLNTIKKYYKKNKYIDTSNIIYICIYILLIKDNPFSKS